MKIKLEVEVEISDENEATESPWWAIVNPAQNMSKDLATAAHQITGPFFSREEAEAYLQRRRYEYGKHAAVWCFSGYWSDRFKMAIRAALKARRDERVKAGRCPEEMPLSTGTLFCALPVGHSGMHEGPLVPAVTA